MEVKIDNNQLAIKLTSPDYFERVNTKLFQIAKSKFYYKEKVDYNNYKFHSSTKKNLNVLEQIGIKWKDVHIQEIERIFYWDNTKSIVKSFLITGEVGEDKIIYLRKEYQTPGAGQTFLFLNEKDKIKMTSVVGIIEQFKNNQTRFGSAVEDTCFEEDNKSNRKLTPKWIKLLGKLLFSDVTKRALGLTDPNQKVRILASKGL